MDAVRAHAARGGLVLGVCNGFQILCESGLLPGVLMRNAALKFICQDVYLRVERSDTPFTRGYNAGQVIRVPVAHGEGNYVADAETIARLEGEGRVAFRYAAPDGSARSALERQRRDQRDRRHPQRARQRARHDAASGKPRRGVDRPDRRARPVRGPDGAFQAGGVALFVDCRPALTGTTDRDSGPKKLLIPRSSNPAPYCSRLVQSRASSIAAFDDGAGRGHPSYWTPNGAPGGAAACVTGRARPESGDPR